MADGPTFFSRAAKVRRPNISRRPHVQTFPLFPRITPPTCKHFYRANIPECAEYGRRANISGDSGNVCTSARWHEMLARRGYSMKSGRIWPTCKHFRNVGTSARLQKCWGVSLSSNSIWPTCKRFRGEFPRIDVPTFSESPPRRPPCEHFRDFAN